jgi:MFS family permease
MRKGSWWHIGSVYLLGVIAFVSMGMLGPLAADLARAFGMSVQAVGVVIGLQVFSGALIGALVGWIIDRAGARPVLFIGCVLIVLTNILTILATSLWIVGLSTLLQGIGLLGIVLGGQVTLSTGFGSGPRQAQSLSIWSTAPFVGVAAGLLLAAPFADSERWRQALMIQVGLGAIGMVIVALLPRVEVTVERTNALAVFREWKVLRLAIGFALISLAGQGTNAVVSLYLHRTHSVSVAAAAGILAFANLAGILGSFGMGFALSRGSDLRATLWTIAIAGVGGGTLLYAGGVSFPLAVAGLMVWTMVMGATVAFVYTLVARVAPHPAQIGAAAGLVNQGSGVGIVFAAPLFFAIYASGNWLGFAGVIAIAWGIMLIVAPVRGLKPVTRAVLSPVCLFLVVVVAGAGSRTASAGEAATGRQLFEQKCSLCHAPGEMGAIMLGRRLGADKSDLTKRTDLPAEYVRQIVRTGLGGMPYFTKVDLTDEQLDAVAAFLAHS